MKKSKDGIRISRVKICFYKSNLPAPLSARLGILGVSSLYIIMWPKHIRISFGGHNLIFSLHNNHAPSSNGRRRFFAPLYWWFCETCAERTHGSVRVRNLAYRTSSSRGRSIQQAESIRCDISSHQLRTRLKWWSWQRRFFAPLTLYSKHDLKIVRSEYHRPRDHLTFWTLMSDQRRKSPIRKGTYA
jgi:hypothetical protein